MILDLKNIFKDYNQDKLLVPVLKDVNLQVEEGEYVAIMGPSGSGKTTLMNIIGCLDRPTSGEFYLAGTDVLKLKDRELSNVRLNSIGFVFQSFHLMPRESALENVSLPLSYAGVKKKERKERALKALARVGLEERATFMPTQLSGGQKQRVAIARAMVNNPKLLLADEPTGALDSKSGAQIMELFQKLNDEGVTIVMITHDKNIADHAKRVYNIIDGEISEAAADSKKNEGVKTAVDLKKVKDAGMEEEPTEAEQAEAADLITSEFLEPLLEPKEDEEKSESEALKEGEEAGAAEVIKEGEQTNESEASNEGEETGAAEVIKESEEKSEAEALKEGEEINEAELQTPEASEETEGKKKQKKQKRLRRKKKQKDIEEKTEAEE